MNIYEVVKYGTPDLKGDYDTIVIVKAPNHMLAAIYASNVFNRVFGYPCDCDSVRLMGADLSLIESPEILYGPIYATAVNRGYDSWRLHEGELVQEYSKDQFVNGEEKGSGRTRDVQND